ncbi:MAG: hypothetical protein HC878_03505 [Leptolyngbyaceae cyanobacterium SL_5_14]|nr:hypothetical protein [Leptolyngbyaceae cyanobacterium SL_5_14]
MQADSTNFDEELLAVIAQTIQRLGGIVPAAPRSSNFSERLLQLLKTLSPLLTGEFAGNRATSWGEILGALDNQADLSAALAAKASQAQLSAAVAPLADKVSLTQVQNIQARHVFNPSTVGAPFTLGTNAQGRLVAGLNADLLDGQDGSYYLNRANHTGTQAIATIAGLIDYLNDTQPLSAELTALASLATLGIIQRVSLNTYQTLAAIATSAGAGDAGKLTLTGVNGYLATSLGGTGAGTIANARANLGVVGAVVPGDALTWHEAHVTAVAGSSYATIFNISGIVSLLGGAIYSVGPGFRLTIDDVVVAQRTVIAAGRIGVSGSGEPFGVVALPPARSTSNMKLEAYNSSGVARDFGWRVCTR